MSDEKDKYLAAFSLGAEHAEGGCILEDNPYSPDTGIYSAWILGWKSMQKFVEVKDWTESNWHAEFGSLTGRTPSEDPPISQGPTAAHSNELTLAITRCMNYLPKHLYEDLLKQCNYPEGSYPYRAPIRDGLRIFVSYQNPPIPLRHWDWCAHYDDAEGPTGEGSTPYMAILDLIDNANPTERAER